MAANALRVACLQTSAVDSVEGNIALIAPMVKEAAAGGAQFLALPENAFLMAVGEDFHRQVYAEAEHPGLAAAIGWAKDLSVWILIGSIAVKDDEVSRRSEATTSEQHERSLRGAKEPEALNAKNNNTKYLNRSYLISPQGIAARYDKIHLFDVSIPGGESHLESSRFAPGTSATLVDTPFGTIGMTICYDVRFPHLYRQLAKAGAEILTTPAAFTRFTGEKGGWHVLNRARAMENGCFVIAPAQCGEHAGSRKTYGHSLIIGPWGDILAEAGTETGVIYADINLADVARTRQLMPSLSHDREFTLQSIAPSDR